MDQNLFSLRTFSLWKSAKAFLIFFLLLIGVNVWGQATLPLSRTAWGSAPTGWTDNGTNRATSFACSGNNGGSLQATGNYYLVRFDSSPDEVTYSLKTGGISGVSKLEVQESTNGSTWTAVATYQSVTYNTCQVETKSLLSTSRYVRFYYTKGTGNMDIDDVSISKLAATPTLTVTPNSITGLNYVQGSGPSAAQSYNLKGTNLTAGITVTAPTNFEVSKTSTGTYSGNITYTAAEGNASAGQTIFVRLKSGLAAATYGGATVYVTNSSTGATTANVSVTGTVTAPVTYTLTYNGNDNTSGTLPANVSFTGGQSGIYLATRDDVSLLEKTGYTLSSWFSQVDGSQSTIIYALGSQYMSNMPNNNVTVYARWGFSIAYNANGGSGSASQNGYYNGTTGVKSGTLTLNNGSAFTRAGYTFGGWKTTATGAVADYIGGATYTHSGSSATVTLYAHWVKNPPKFTVTPTSLSGFNYVESNGPSASQSFVLNGNDLENTDTDPVELVTIDDRFEIAESTAGPYSHSLELPSTYTGASKTFYVRLKAGLTANTNYTDTVLVSGGSAVEANYAEVALSGSVVACLAPTTQSSVASFASLTSSGMTVNLNAGNGVGRVVVINTVNSFTNPVSSNTLPTANTVYGGSGEQVISVGTGNTVAVTGLAPSTAYYVRVYEYNICSNNYTYNTTTATNNPRTVTTPCKIPANPNGEVTSLENPACSTAILIYELSDPKEDGVTYYWQTTATGTSTANPVVFTDNPEVSEPYSVTVSGNYYVRAYNGFCWSAGSYVTQTPISILSAPSITTQPTNQNVVAGANASFSVATSGSAPFTYQWQESPTGAAGTWVNVGTSSNTLTLTNVPLSKNGYKYHVIVSNDCGSRTSNVVTLSVITGPCLSEDFNGTTTPSGWLATNVSWTEYTGGGSFNANNGTITTPKLTRPSKVTFDLIRTTNTTAKTLLVKVSTTGQNTGFNETIATYTHSNTTSGGTTSIDLDLSAYSTEDQVWIRLEKTSSTTSPWRFDNFEVFCAPACTPATITVFPISGPANTIVTITGTDFTAASTVKFGAANAVVQYISATQIKATVPATADGDIVVDTSLDCDSETAFTFIKEDASGCEAVIGSGTGTIATDLIIYEVYDENGGSGGTVSIYNGTSAAVNLADYSFYRANDYGVDYGSYGTLSGSLPAGGLAVIGVSGSACGYTPTGNGNITGGFNANDGLQLRKGSVVVDDFKAPNYVGYYLKRKIAFLSPKATFADLEWTTEDVAAGECLTNVASGPPEVRTAPIIITQPSYVVNCDVVNTSLALTATEGYVGGNALAYQWYELKNTGAWTAVVDGGVYSGATTRTLTISDVNGLNNYQYYCQVRENTQTCYTATQATQIKEASNTWASNVWTNGTPVLGSKVIIAGSYNTQTNGALDVCDLTINAVGTLRVRPNFPITVKKKITNNGSATNFIVESDANLIQTDNVTNEGNIQVQRTVTDMNNNAAVAIDYVYWSSPVSGQTIKGTNGFSPNTPANGYLQYNESNDKFTVTNDATFQTGKGYAIRAEAGTDGYDKTYNFNGIPNNGNIQYQNLKWTDANHGFNLVGNPYPSNIDFDLLYQLNSAKMYSTVWFWTNNSYTAAQAGSGYNGNNYAVYNGTGGSPATYNPENPYDGSVVPNGKIKVGQAFIIQSKAGGKDQPLDFANNIRVTDNGNFYQKSTPKNRFWLNMTSPSNLVNTILLGYIEGATNNYETDFDGELFAIGSDSFYSILGARKLAIQGKANNFSADDVITLGNVFAANGTYKIKLQTAEGLFDNNQKIYLRDKLLNKYFDLSSNESYTFEASKGSNNSRFEIVYKAETLTNSEIKKSDFQVYRNGESFVVESSYLLDQVEVYDAVGKLIYKVNVNNKKIVIDTQRFPQGFYIIKSENSGNLTSRKVIK